MLAGYAITKNQWVLKSLNRFKADVVNLTAQDLACVGPQVRGSDGADSEIGLLSGRMVSANVMRPVSGSRGNKAIRPYVVASVPDRTVPGHQIRIAFLGISDESKELPAGYRVQDPVEAVRRIVPQAKRESDLIVVLAHASIETASSIAQEVPGLAAVIAGNGKEFTMPVTLGRVSVVFTTYETRMLGELRFYRTPEGLFTVKNRFIALDSAVPEDQSASDFVAESRQAVKREVEKFTKPMETAPDPSTGNSATDSNFVSAQTCLECHRAQYLAWANTAHARAMNSLAGRAAELDTGCLVCHTTGFNRGGFQNITQSRMLINVQCEECHGPGRAHIAKPDKTYGHIADVQTICSRCHTAETSAEFKFETYWTKIRH
jgi:2',3'-cyclic-nucleotide 2'-phosphodiesterase (5'-nucleotidase family)